MFGKKGFYVMKKQRGVIERVRKLYGPDRIRVKDGKNQVRQKAYFKRIQANGSARNAQGRFTKGSKG